jgi:hypothetical protein
MTLRRRPQFADQPANISRLHWIRRYDDFFDVIAFGAVERISKMKRLLLIGVAACAFAAMPTLSASAMPRATADMLITSSDGPVVLARGGHGHGHMGRGGRGHHYGWGRGRHRGWR